MTVSPPKTEAVFWQQSVPELLAHLNATASGLTSSEAADRLKQVGPNILRPPRKRALVIQFLARFKNPLVIILLIASAVSALTGEQFFSRFC
jgi:Mg2+-importing ATPase